jgi:Flp pilus assembly pilin Flp
VAFRNWIRRLTRTVRRDEEGAQSLETILIIGAIAIPVLIVILKWGWPRIKTYFEDGMNDLEVQTDNAQNNGTTR